MAERKKVMLVEARYYGDIADELAKGAVATLSDAGVDVERLDVPGVFELPAAIRWANEAGKADGFIALGCVIRGETDHYDHVCRESSRALMDLTVEDGIALGFGVLTCENRDQAWARADVGQKNKGREAAVACLKMMDLSDDFLGAGG